LFSLTEVAEIWYSERTADETYWNGTPLQGSRIRLRMKIVSGETGDSLYPVFNSNGDMISFARSYVIKKDGKELNRFDVYTDEKNYFASYVGNKWEVKEENNFFGKIPVIYYSQPNPEWADVQDLISRLEVLISNNADTNDYFGSPMVKVKGTVKGFAKKGEQGKVIELESGADAEYMSWDQSPKNVELEYKILRSLIFDNTDTPDISFEQMKSLGTYSGIALKMLFLAPHLKCAAKEGNFGKCIQRRINFLKTAMNKIKIGAVAEGMTLDVSPEFEYYMPADDESFINMLSVATGNKPVLSQKSAVSISPLTSNADTEYQQIQEEENSPAALDRIN
jgi:SPP1 family phage portal protein